MLWMKHHPDGDAAVASEWPEEMLFHCPFLSAQWVCLTCECSAVTSLLLYFLHFPLWLIPWPSFLPLPTVFCTRVLALLRAQLYAPPRGGTCRKFFWRPWCVARSRARMLKLSLSSLSPIRDSFSRESSFFLMWDSTWWWPLPCEKEGGEFLRRGRRKSWAKKWGGHFNKRCKDGKR